ncbi:transposase [bacterium]|nr:transposase [bacterium]
MLVDCSLFPGGDPASALKAGRPVEGTQKVLGLRQGSTETAEFATEFLEELVNRGLSATHGIVWVVDGATGMLKALRTLALLTQRLHFSEPRLTFALYDEPSQPEEVNEKCN